MTGARDFWSRRQAAVAEEDAAERAAAKSRAIEAELAEREALDDAEILAELDLPDPDSLQPGDDIRAFMSRAVPERLRRRALRQLWRLNPVLANLDGLVDYGEDFTASGTADGIVRTSYQVGKGMLAHIEELARQAEAKAAADTEPAAAPDAETVAEAVVETDTDTTPDRAGTAGIAQGTDFAESETMVAPRPRKMRFAFEE